jgi:hypothetical protein
MRGSTTTDWEELPSDPDLSDDLGYVPVEFEVIRTTKTGDPTYLFLPNDDDLLMDEAYIVAEEDATCSVADMR